MSTLKLLSHLKNKQLEFKNRVFMAPMTRSRAPKQVPTDLIAEYYSQRASAGLIFTEGTQISPEGVGVIIEARHLCMQMRGVEKQHGQAVTSAMLGGFRHNKQTRDEFLSLVRTKNS